MLQKTKEIFNEFLRRKVGYKIKQAYPRDFDKYLLNLFDRELEGIEIGTWRGEHAEWMLKILPIKKLYLIDNYGYYISSNKEDYDMQGAKNIMMKRLRKHWNKYDHIEKNSDEACKELKSKKFDFIYHIMKYCL